MPRRRQRPDRPYWLAWLLLERDRWGAWFRQWRRPKTLGERGEAAAARYLRRKGYTILARQARQKIGEIDIIAVHRGCVVFAEVKTRRGKLTGRPADSVTENKQERLTRVALAYLKHHGLMETPARFDVIEIIWPEGARRPEITHFENAFEAAGPAGMYS